MSSLLKVQNVRKSYGHVVALSDVSFEAGAGEVVALLGDNGAGKSTLVSLLSGVQKPDDGRITVGGEDAQFRSPADARAIGIETVYQTLELAPNLDVATNLFLNREIRHSNPVLRRIGWLDRRAMWDSTAEILEGLHVTISTVRQRVSQLSGGQRQSIAVGRAVGWDARIVIMDEPVAALGVEQTNDVLRLIERLGRSGMLVIFITHNMREVTEVCDRAVILRRGSVVADLEVSDEDPRELVDYITGAK